MSLKLAHIPSQKFINESLAKIPIEYFQWGVTEDHYKIDMPHRHEFAEFLFFTEGGGSHEIDFISHKVLSNSIHILAPSSVHFLKRDKQSDGFTIAFDPHFLNSNSIHRMVYPLDDQSIALNLSEQQFNHITSIVDVIHAQIQANKGYYKEKAFLLAMELLIHTIANEIQLNHLKDSAAEGRILRNFKADLLKNIHISTSVNFYARRLNISDKHLSNHLRKITNKSAKQWITEALLISVKKQLINSDLSIKEIAFHHSYDESSLSKLFKKQVGYTMTEYRSNKNVQF